MTVICGILILALAGSLLYNNDLIKRNEMQRDIIMRMKEQIDFYRSKEEDWVLSMIEIAENDNYLEMAEKNWYLG